MSLPERDADGQLPAFAWPGGYPIVYLSADGSEWDADCANQGDAEPPVTEYYVFYEGTDVVCSGCGDLVKSAYGDPEEEE